MIIANSIAMNINKKIIILPIVAFSLILSSCDELKRTQSVSKITDSGLKDLLITEFDLTDFRKMSEGELKFDSKPLLSSIVRQADQTCESERYYLGPTLQNSNGSIVISSLSESICKNKEMIKKHVLSEERISKSKAEYEEAINLLAKQLGGSYENIKTSIVNDHGLGDDIFLYKTTADIIYKGIINGYIIYSYYILSDKAAITISIKTFDGIDKKILENTVLKTIKSAKDKINSL
jgi:hypothetical protein